MASFEAPKGLPAANTTVTRVFLGDENAQDLVELACGHATTLDHDDDNASLVGAATSCDECPQVAP